MTDFPDINDTLRNEGEDAVRRRIESARPFYSNALLDPVEVELQYTDLTIDPIPPREWLVPDRIPSRNVTLISGNGGVGKSLLLLQLAAAVSLDGRDWIKTLPVGGPVMYLSCEDEGDEICRRVEAIAASYRVSREEIAAQLHVVSFVGRDAVLGFAGKSGRISSTPLFDQLRREALKIRPRLIVLDSAADVFSGNESDRSQTRQFITMLRGLACEADTAIILASHPSLTGMATGTGLSGSTAWHNSVRARGYLKNRDDVDDPTLRVLEWHKNQYGPMSESIVLRWRDGVYVPEPSAGSLDQLAADTKVDHLFLDLLRRLKEQGRNVTDRKSSAYAPAVFAEQPEAKKDKVSKKRLVDAMNRLFAAGKITVISEGPPSRQRTRIIENSEIGESSPPDQRTSVIEQAAAAPKGIRVVDEAPPGARCQHCLGNDPPVLKIKDAGVVGGKSETLHEHCAGEWFATMRF